MIQTYGFSLIGTSHEEKEDGVCQDSHGITKLSNGTVIAAVADGVGSCKYSDIASKIAVTTSLNVCEAGIMSNQSNDVISLIKEAFTKAESEIEAHSIANNHTMSEYHTTLTLVIYDGKHISYGHCGDGGIIGLTTKGDYVQITTPQKDEGIYVVPLREKERWIFGTPEEKLASILLATDGVYDELLPSLLKGQPNEIYIPLAKYFMDNSLLENESATIENIGNERKDFLNSAACASITDDKTIVVLINSNIIPDVKEDAYYQEPDWDALQKERYKKLYPHLVSDNEVDENNEIQDTNKTDDCKKVEDSAEVEEENRADEKNDGEDAVI